MLRLWKDNLKEQWASGYFQKETVEETALRNANALGVIAQLDRLLEIDLERMEEILYDEE